MTNEDLVIIRGCDETVHAGVVMEAVAIATGGDARTICRSTLTGEVYRFHPARVASMVGMTDDERFDIAVECDHP